MQSIYELLLSRQTCRNWSSIPVESDKQKIILETINKTPVKSGRIQWKLLILDETKETEKNNIFNNNVVRDYVGPNVLNSQTESIVSNPQILSPFTLIWLIDYSKLDTLEYYQIKQKTTKKNNLMEEFTRDCYMGTIGQAFTAMLAATQLGLDTGFCSCFSNRKISFVNEKLEAILGLGIGYGLEPKRNYNSIEYLPIPHEDISTYII